MSRLLTLLTRTDAPFFPQKLTISLALTDCPATPEIVTESFDTAEGRGEIDDELVDAEYDDNQRQLLNAKRLTRNDRLDNRRYHTAGAIEDIKVNVERNQSST